MKEHKRGPGFRRPRPGLNSFTLVEVVIAIGIIAFVLVSILGLMTYASQLTQQADTYSRLSNVSGQVIAQFSSQPYSASTNIVGTNGTLFFTYEGLPTNTAAGAYYQCNFTNANPTPWALASMMQIQLSIRWPMATSPNFPNTNVIIMSALNYE